MPMTTPRPTAERPSRSDRRSTSTRDRRSTSTRDRRRPSTTGDRRRPSTARPEKKKSLRTASVRYGESRRQETLLWSSGFGAIDDPLPLLSGDSPATLADYYREAERARREAAAEREERRAARAAEAEQ